METKPAHEPDPRPRVPVWGVNPWWIPPFLGQVPTGLTDHHLRLLGAVSLALFIEEYDLSMLNAALKHIAADLGMRETDFGLYLGLIRLGALPAFLVIPLADRFGRRSLFLASLFLTGIFTFLTALAQSPAQFVAVQMIARTFFVAGAAVAFVMVTEELPALHRGWGMGMLGALGSMGHGLGVVLFGILEGRGLSWRWLYVVGLIPVLAYPIFARAVQETRRFDEYMASRTAPAASAWLAWIEPLVALARTFPMRAVGVAVAGFVPAVGLVSAFQFTGYFTQHVHGWSGGQYALMVTVGGALGIIGNVVAGRLGDRFGRRLVGFGLLALFPIFVVAFYRGPSWLMPFAWVAFLFCAQGGRVVLRAISTELFPTSQRSAASGLYNVLETLGAATGLFALYFSSASEGDLARVTPYLAAVVVVGGAVLLGFPETKQRELEDIDGISPGGGH